MSEPKHWWETMPAILGGVAAVIVAIGGLAGSLEYPGNDYRTTRGAAGASAADRSARHAAGPHQQGQRWLFGSAPAGGRSASPLSLPVFALDAMLDVAPGSDRETVLEGAQGHVLAAGEIVGLYQQTVAPTK